MYINEIVRINYKCNWKCKFCNVLKTNNFWKDDISNKENIYNILKLSLKYSKHEMNNLILSFSWWEPTLNPHILRYIKLAKTLWIWNVQIQTNWMKLYNNLSYTEDLINSWLDEIFLALHSNNDSINKQLGCQFFFSDFVKWTKYIKENKLQNKIKISLNIVVSKINIFNLTSLLNDLEVIWFFDILDASREMWLLSKKMISFWLVQPNGYAFNNKDELLLDFDANQLESINQAVNLCERNWIMPDFHFTSPPLCIMDYKEYNLEYQRLKSLENDINNNLKNESNLETYKILWSEKEKIQLCNGCLNQNYCLWFYKNWIDFVWMDYIKQRVLQYIEKQKFY